MTKFKVGDKVRVISDDCDSNLPIGSVRRIVNIKTTLSNPYCLEDCGHFASVYKEWELELVKNGKNTPKTKPVKFVVFYDEDDHDPMKTFSTEKELKSWITEAKDDEDIDFSSIKIFEVKKEFEIKLSTKVRLSAKK